MKRINWNLLSADDRRRALARPSADGSSGDGSSGDDSSAVDASVRAIVAAVKRRGDEAVREFSLQFDGFDGFDGFGESIAPVPQSAFDRAWDSLDANIHAALDGAISAIRRFHEAQLPTELSVETMPGVTCRRVARPIRSVGLYVPAGRAPLPSTVLMLGVPSLIARNPTRILCSPPRADGSIDPAVLVAARKCGITTVYPLGGAQAIAAMAYGTATVSKVDKIFGPGNRYVDLAKRLVSIDPDGAAIDLPAGPSELMVIADDSANAAFVASDLLAQAEHDPVAHVVLVCPSTAFADRVDDEIRRQLDTLADVRDPRTARGALTRGCSVVVADLDQAIDVANQYAPEHLIVATTDDKALVERVDTAGAVFAGSWTPAALGDYCSGTNHVLPTGGFARAASGLSVESFLRYMTVQTATQQGFELAGPIAATLANIEGLTAHERSLAIRL